MATFNIEARRVLIFQLALRLAFATLAGMSDTPPRKSTSGAKKNGP
jgi:hypothetical protein